MNVWEKYDILEENIHVTLIADSIHHSNGKRATTALIRLPRFLLPQMNTYRVMSRNVASSRAKRFSVTANEVLNNPYKPYVWQANHSGMQTETRLPRWKEWIANKLWIGSSLTQLGWASSLNLLGVSKQYTNRLIEPYMYVDYLVTSTEWDNFFYQRDDYHAQLEIQIVARRLRMMLQNTTPTVLQVGEWHLPFDAGEKFDIWDRIKISVARCARTSYINPIGYTPDKDLTLFTKLIGSPPHLSPFEHQLVARGTNGGNIKGFTQFRKIIESRLLLDKEFIEESVKHDTLGYWIL